ncbi:Inositol-tetrakisphosphate 1-kinase [Heracleum sosnowskyi]|uniref:Inositol-tetrakisphosphate 1-kinase n=1 Tax=Heracleum sosnowskyi TaxID=360622 RepID=A0AAD8JB27_9APIA|nr:Inositol-tetrakisphosphate 1-kinase [Heracleum sosnowskyi]
MSGESKRLRVGYALEPKKIKTFITLSLLTHTHSQGIDLIQIDPTKPLTQPQPPYDVIIHKLHSTEWNQQLLNFSSQNPKTLVIDSPLAIQRLHDRVSMLDVVAELNLSPSVTTPKQVFVYDSKSLFDSVSNDLKFKFPIIAKPLVADGTANSHNMALVFNKNGVKSLEPPIVLQEFVNHGGVIFKVYVVGNYVQCVKRSSLPDICEEDMERLGDVMPFSQISNLNSSGYKVGVGDDVEMPSLSFVDQVAKALGKGLKLNLFNFDMIRDANGGDCARYYVIDINYFPGYAKMPSYESVLADFFKDIVKQNSVAVLPNGQGSNNREVPS